MIHSFIHQLLLFTRKTRLEKLNSLCYWQQQQPPTNNKTTTNSNACLLACLLPAIVQLKNSQLQKIEFITIIVIIITTTTTTTTGQGKVNFCFSFFLSFCWWPSDERSSIVAPNAAAGSRLVIVKKKLPLTFEHYRLG